MTWLDLWSFIGKLYYWECEIVRIQDLMCTPHERWPR